MQKAHPQKDDAEVTEHGSLKPSLKRASLLDFGQGDGHQLSGLSIWGHKNDRLSRIETLKVPSMVQTRHCEPV